MRVCQLSTVIGSNCVCGGIAGAGAGAGARAREQGVSERQRL